ncbi:hypothetical protein [Microbacterium kunmingense]|uniref:hypothetical protein n=1 Tax=Microbacterium kunmingense TaxID=2915939 RepID=UPI0020039440|nr:hypothetical protein [Microbacterium kunmingense]
MNDAIRALITARIEELDAQIAEAEEAVASVIAGLSAIHKEHSARAADLAELQEQRAELAAALEPSNTTVTVEVDATDWDEWTPTPAADEEAEQ